MWQQVAAFAGSSGVALGAIGAHGLSGKSDKIREDWKKATQYQMVHALAMATLPMYQKTPARAAAGILFSAGITFFSGSIYYSSLTDDKRMAKAAPVGGICMILGWATMALLKR
ncbi:unnamed protein product [Hapterophycus canaliculatus]